MIAQIVLINGVETALLTAPPNWASEVKVTLDLPTDVTREPITLKESRRAFAQSARYTLNWRSYMSNTKDAEELRIFLTRVRGEPVAVPLWPDQCALNNNIVRGTTHIPLADMPARWGTVWIIANDDFSTWEIVSVSGISSLGVMTLAVGTRNPWASATTSLYPILLGRLTDRPKPELLTDESFEVDLTVKETSAYNFRLSPSSGAIPVVGSHVPNFQTTPLFTLQPHFSQPTDWTEEPDIVFETVGFGREEQKRVYDHRNVRGIEFEFYQSVRADIISIERFWRNQRGPVLPFMVPTWRGDMRMRADTPVAGNLRQIKIEDSEFCNPGRETQPGDQFVALVDSNGAIDPRQLTAGNNTPGNMFLTSSTNMSAHSFATTILSRLLLARFKNATLEWTYTTPYLATTKLQFVDLPPEYASAPSPLPEPAYLFIFTEVGVRVDRYTSYENTIQIPTGAYAGTYHTAPYSFETLKTGLKLDQEKLDLKSFKFTGNPLNKLWPFALDGILTVDIIEVIATNPQSATAIVRFHGDVVSVDSDYKATAIPFGNFFDRKVPRFLLSVSDNYVQFSPPTHLAASAFKITATFPNLIDTTSQTVIVNNATAHAKAADYFSGGWIETGTGATKEMRGILHSAPAAGIGVTLHIDRPLLKAVRGQSVDLYPGYDGSIDQCDTKFNNRINFGGHPYVPNVNPTVKAMKPKQVQGGKK